MSITPGPWAAIPDSREDSEGDWYVLTPDEDVIAIGLSEPDAALIAAAPDLLAALKEMVIWMPSGFAPQSQSIAMKMAYAAIAKAEGTGETLTGMGGGVDGLNDEIPL